jgi:hypothetical protein
MDEERWVDPLVALPSTKNQGICFGSYERFPMACRQLRKVEALSSDREHVYECDSCLWVVNVHPDRHPDEIEAEFNEHNCREFSRARRGLSIEEFNWQKEYGCCDVHRPKA